MMIKRITVIVIASVLVLVLIIIGIFSALGGRQLTLNSQPGIDTVTINGVNKSFQQGMKVGFDKTLTIAVNQSGYDSFSVTLDPKNNTTQSYTIKLTTSSSLVDNSGSNANDNLLQAAKKSTTNIGLLSGSQLNVLVTAAKSLSNGYFVYTIEPLDSTQGGSDTATVVVQKQSDGYHVILGPSSNLSSSDVASLPADVVAYLRSIKAVGM